MASAETFDPSTISGISAGFDNLNGFSDSVAFTDTLALDDEPLFPADWDQETPPYDGNLYSTPLSWEPPEPKVEPLPTTSYTTMNTLTPAQQEKLRNIAMPQHLQYRSQHSPNSSASTKSRSPEHVERERSRKRKASADDGDDDDDDDDSNPPVKKTAHNMIEKRYRTNLNDKIAALRDSVPSLRIMTKSARGEDTADDREELQGLTPAHKLNKATVLSKATEYINHLEKRNKRLQEENAEQKARLAAFETLFRSGSMGYNPAPIQHQHPFQFSDYTPPGPSPGGMEPQGMIQVPDDMRRLHGQMSQQTFAVPQEHYQQPRQMGPNGWANNGYFGKLMVGSLAGLMILEGFSEAEQDEDSPGARGLFAVPVQLLRSLSSSLQSSLHFNIFGHHLSAAQTLAYMKGFLVIGVLLYVFLPSLFATRPKKTSEKTQIPVLSAAPSLASPISVRRRAWLTAIQNVWVPRHSIWLEIAAVFLKVLKVGSRSIIGVKGYLYISGLNPQQEAARAKAWSIAIDAQLAGGDAEINVGRIFLTLLASATLPDTPARLMLKALHIRVALWELCKKDFIGGFVCRELAAKWAQSCWTDARLLWKVNQRLNNKQDDDLPAHLSALLAQDYEDVLTDPIKQRAYNLAWNLPTTEETEGANSGMDGVVEDFAIRSPLDALAAWYSSLVLQRALMTSLQNSESDLASQLSIVNDITLAVKVAPPGSASHTRALVTRALLVKDKRGVSIAEAMTSLSTLDKNAVVKKDGTASLVKGSTPTSSLLDLKMSLRCSMAIAHLERFPSPMNPVASHRIINNIPLNNLTLLGFTASFKLMETINRHGPVAISCANSLEKMAGCLRIWIGGPDGEKTDLDSEVKRSMVEKCLVVTRRIVGMEDAGYETMSDEDAGEGC